MKKTVYFLLIIILLFSISSCSKKSTNPPSDVSTSENVVLDDSYIALEFKHDYCAFAGYMKHHNDILRQSDFVATDIPTEITETILGKEMLLHYDNLSLKFSSGQIADIYINENETVIVSKIRDTDSYMDIVDLEARNDSTQKTRDECLIIVKNTLKSFTDEFDNYVLTNEKSQTYSDNGIQRNIYTFTFRRKIGDIFAEDQVQIDIIENGKIERFHSTSFSSLKGVREEDLPDINVTRPYAIQKLKSICDEMRKFTYTFEEKEVKAEALEGNIVALTYNFNVTFTPIDTNEKAFFDTVSIVVYENKK